MNNQTANFSQNPAIPQFPWAGGIQDDPFALQLPAAPATYHEGPFRTGPSPFPAGSKLGLAAANASQSNPTASLTSDHLRQLRLFYAIVGSERLIAETLISVPALFYLLRDAVAPLRIAFGEQTLLRLETLESPDEGGILRVMVHASASCGRSPADLMRDFKRTWWLKKCVQSRASLVFDYEIGDGI